MDEPSPHARHGEPLVIVQASHVGYDPQSRQFGVLRPARTAQRSFGANCGKLSGVLQWNQQYVDAGHHLRLRTLKGEPVIAIDNALLDPHRNEGLFLRLDLEINPATPVPSTIVCMPKWFAPGTRAARADAERAVVR